MCVVCAKSVWSANVALLEGIMSTLSSGNLRGALESMFVCRSSMGGTVSGCVGEFLV
jgi:hypothetical protein